MDLTEKKKLICQLFELSRLIFEFRGFDRNIGTVDTPSPTGCSRSYDKYLISDVCASVGRYVMYNNSEGNLETLHGGFIGDEHHAHSVVTLLHFLRQTDHLIFVITNELEPQFLRMTSAYFRDFKTFK